MIYCRNRGKLACLLCWVPTKYVPTYPVKKPEKPITELSTTQRLTLRHTLQTRFSKNPNRHPGLTWEEVDERLQERPDVWLALHRMEATGGEPDVVFFEESPAEFLFVDCSAESPLGRRSLCYDPEALEERKEHKPAHSALGMAQEIGIELLTETQYRALQRLGTFDTKTSSWVATPSDIRELGGALFGDRRYNHVFLYHNGAQSYYNSRGFRGLLQI